ncbi:MAG TPA: hypothetical protein VEJ67_09115 [Candidatus Cybelea sp.]|nr:hypothetical protein [Candidatus Cybelea sp.]
MKRATLASLALTLGILAISAFAQNPSPFSLTQFSATSSTTMKGQIMKTKIARSGNKLRMDMPGSDGKRYTLVLLDEHKAYMVMGPEMCMQMNQLGAAASNPFASSAQAKIDTRMVGAGTMNGHPVKIEQLTMTPANGGKPVNMKVWSATDLQGFPVRTEVETANGPVTTDYTDISLSAPSDSLFAAPQNCRQMPMMPGGPTPQ